MESKALVWKSQPKKNLWKPEEDLILKTYIEAHGEGNWEAVSKNSGKYTSISIPIHAYHVFGKDMWVLIPNHLLKHKCLCHLCVFSLK